MTSQGNRDDLDQPTVCQIRLRGHLGSQWTGWFDGLTVTLTDDGDTLLAGTVADQAALHGLLRKVRDLGLTLLAVQYGPDRTKICSSHMLAFCLGAVSFYFLLDKARIVPQWISLWGLVTVFPMLVGTITQMFGYTISFFFYLPYVPFELVIVVWILVKGTPEMRYEGNRSKQLRIARRSFLERGRNAGAHG